MKTLKTVLLTSITQALLVVCLSLAVITGCKTTTNPDGTTTQTTISPEQTARAVKVATKTATRIALQQHPEIKPQLQLAQVALETLVLQGNYSPQAVREILAQLDVTVDDTVWVAVTAALEIYEGYVGDVLAKQLDKNAYVRPVLVALCQGLHDGLQ